MGTEFQLGRLEKNSGETDKRQIAVKAIGQTELKAHNLEELF